jgi:hypothetical protein
VAGKKKKKGAVNAAPLIARRLTIDMVVVKRYADRVPALFEEAVLVLEDRIAGSAIEATIGKPQKAKEG